MWDWTMPSSRCYYMSGFENWRRRPAGGIRDSGALEIRRNGWDGIHEVRIASEGVGWVYIYGWEMSGRGSSAEHQSRILIVNKSSFYRINPLLYTQVAFHLSTNQPPNNNSSKPGLSVLAFPPLLSHNVWKRPHPNQHSSLPTRQKHKRNSHQVRTLHTPICKRTGHKEPCRRH